MEKPIYGRRSFWLKFNLVFSFDSYVLSELGHREKLVDVSVWSAHWFRTKK